MTAVMGLLCQQCGHVDSQVKTPTKGRRHGKCCSGAKIYLPARQKWAVVLQRQRRRFGSFCERESCMAQVPACSCGGQAEHPMNAKLFPAATCAVRPATARVRAVGGRAGGARKQLASICMPKQSVDDADDAAPLRRRARGPTCITQALDFAVRSLGWQKPGVIRLFAAEDAFSAVVNRSSNGRTFWFCFDPWVVACSASLKKTSSVASPSQVPWNSLLQQIFKDDSIDVSAFPQNSSEPAVSEDAFRGVAGNCSIDVGSIRGTSRQAPWYSPSPLNWSEGFFECMSLQHVISHDKWLIAEQETAKKSL